MCLGRGSAIAVLLATGLGSTVESAKGNRTLRGGKEWGVRGGGHRGVQLQYDVNGGGPGAKGKVNNAVHAQLPHVLQPPRAHMLAQLQAEVAGLRRPILEYLCAPPTSRPTQPLACVALCRHAPRPAGEKGHALGASSSSLMHTRRYDTV